MKMANDTLSSIRSGRTLQETDTPLGVMGVFFILATTVSAVVVTGSLGFGATLGMMGMACAIFAPLVSRDEIRLDPFHPYAFFTFKVGIVAYLIPFLGYALSPELLGRKLAHEIPQATSVAALFFGFVFLGYWTGIGRWLACRIPLPIFPREEGSWGKLRRNAILLYAVGWGARIQSILLGATHFSKSYGGAVTLISSILTPLSEFCLLSFVLLLWIQFRRSDRPGGMDWIIATALVLIEVSAGVMTGSRSSMIMPLVYAAIVFHKTVRPVSWKMIAVGGCLVVFVLGPLTTAYRTVYSSHLQGQNIEEAQTMEAVQNSADLEAIRRGLERGQYGAIIEHVQGRLSSKVEATLQVMDQVPERVEFQGGDTFLPGMFVMMVPRVIWSDKPRYKTGQKRAYTFWGKTSGVAMGIGMPAELYYNFGWLGLLGGMIIGVIIQFFYIRYLLCNALELTSIIRFVYIVAVVFALGHLISYAASLIRAAIWYYGYLVLVNGRLPLFVDPRNVFFRN